MSEKKTWWRNFTDEGDIEVLLREGRPRRLPEIEWVVDDLVEGVLEAGELAFRRMPGIHHREQ